MRITIHSLSAIMLAALVAGQAWGVDAGPKLEIMLPGKTVPELPAQTEVIAWGANYSGQTPVPSSAQSGVVAIAAGGSHTVALKQDGSVIAWGYNSYGQTTVPSSAQSGVVAIAAGWDHTVALKQDGSVLAWGYSGWGQTNVPSSAQSGVVAIAAGPFHTVALKQDGSVFAWGRNDFGQTTVPSSAQSGVVAIAAGWYHTVALKQDGSVLAWGRNDFGQTNVPSSAQSGVVAIAAGYDHTVALKQDGSVLAWGDNDYGQRTVPSSAQSGVVAIAAGGDHTVALKQDGSVIAWGYNYSGQTTVPSSAQSGVVAIAAGRYHTLALKSASVLDFEPSLYGAAVNLTKVITLTNTGVGDTTISPSLDFEGTSGFSIEPASTITLAAGESAALTVRFTDTGSTPGTHGATLRIASNLPRYLIPLTATVTEPEVTLTTNGQSQATGTTSDYGTLPISRDATRTFTLRNDGNGALDLSAVSIDGPAAGDYVLAGLSPGSIAPGQSQSFTLRFAPTVAGERRARLVITSNDRDEASFELNLLGRGTAMHLTNADASDVILPGQVYPQGTFDMDTVIERSFTLRNSGSTPLTGLRFVWEAAAPNGFTLSPALPSSLAAGESITFTLRFTPLLRGAMDLPVRLLADQPDALPITLRFTGTVRAPKLGVRDAAGPLSSEGQGNRVIAWGSNYFNQTTVPGSVQSGVVAITAGADHTVALKQDGSVIAWGHNGWGQTNVPSSAQSGVAAIAAGGAHTVALKQDGSVIAWGWNDYGQRTVPSSAQSGVAAIAAGYAHTVALKQDGSVIAWGWNDYGQRAVPSSAQSGVVAIAAGGAHTVALKQDGSVIAWGWNDYGQRTVPSRAQSGVVAIAAGGEHTVALTQDGSVIAWGNNGWGQRAVPSSLQSGVQSGVVAIAAGYAHTVALKQDGSVIAWGSNGNGQRTVPSSAQSGVVAIAAGADHTVALKFTGLLFGSSLLGQSVNYPISVASEGELALTPLLTEITGPDADQFSLTSTLPISIAPGASPVPLQVRFTPTQVGSMNATLRLHSNDPMTPVFELPLKGTGTFNLTATKPGISGSSFTYAPLRLDRQTGLMLQKISFTNTTGVPLHGLRLILSSVASGVQVYSSSVGPVPGTYEVIYSNPIATAEAISFDLVYFDPKRRTAASIHPVISAEALLVPEPDSLVVPGTVVPLRSARATPQGPFLEWNSVPKATYVVEYSNDAGTTWFSAVHRLSTTTTRMFWVDRGQPETKTKPVGVPNKPGGRLYRVKKL